MMEKYWFSHHDLVLPSSFILLQLCSLISAPSHKPGKITTRHFLVPDSPTEDVDLIYECNIFREYIG